MFCKKCGTQLSDGAKFCKKCGTPIKGIKNENIIDKLESEEKSKDTDIDEPVPVNISDKVSKYKKTNKEKKAEKKAKRKAERAGWSTGKKIRRFMLKLILHILLMFVLITGVAGELTYFGIIDVPVMGRVLSSTGLKESDYTEFYNVKSPDADDFYEQNSQIISEVDVNNSDDVQTETEICNNLAKRGFEDYPVSTEYSMDGDYFDATIISETSSEKHPMYQTNYITANGEVWTIFIINGSVMANPVSYNMQSGLGVQVIISESETVTSYDSTTNKFYETIPDKSALIVKVVEEINAKTLENLTFGVIDGL